ncbi:MAG: hydantoinase/oxoprolinase family protein [Alphaproteobacteria bacterium]|nr:hydantoinase/oxoprolinase family protein [Alphaproteobacteria bacterium]
MTIKTEGRIRVGVDVGGTFTDFVLVDENRDLIFTGKRLTTSEDPSVAITEGLERLVEEAGTSVPELDAVVHGTTLVANTMIERKGAKIGLITTEGFRDSLEMGREIRYDLYDLFFEKPKPLAPRFLRLAIDERVNSNGEVLRPLDESGLQNAAQQLKEEGVEAIAICFMHSYANDSHERRAKEVLEAAFPNIPITTSTEVAPEIREYERANTACANAYVLPLMQRYLGDLSNKLSALGLKQPLYLMQSSGGIASVETGRKAPIHLIESGPAAGATAGAFYGRLTDTHHLISFDMGGTTAKMCLIEEFEPEHAHEFEAGRVRRFKKGSGLPLKVPVIDLIEIGAGGGSLARVDNMGLLKVGPDSSGSDPGPVCYGQGGTQPAVTDADLLLGYLSPEYFLGGEMDLDLSSVEGALQDTLASATGLSVTDVAAGIHSIVNENMAAATRMYIAEKGRDPRRYALVASGGAGPVHAYGMAKLLKINRVICPLGAGVLSALGFLVAAPGTDAVRSYVSRLETLDWNRLNDLFAEMEAEALAQIQEAGADPSTVSMRRRADMRYSGQGFEIDVPVPDGKLDESSAATIRQIFLDRYQELFGRQISDLPMEALTWRVYASGPTPNVELNFAGQQIDEDPADKGERQVYFPETGYAACKIYNRYALKPGDSFRGPAVIEERESTAVAGPDTTVSIDKYLNLIIDIDAPTEQEDN